MLTWTTLIVSLVGAFANAQSVVSTSDLCKGVISDLVAVELSGKSRSAYLKNSPGATVEVSVPVGKCYFLNQSIVFSSKNTAGISTWWGRGFIRRMTPESQQSLILEIAIQDKSMTETLIAPDCTGSCHRVLARLPAGPDVRLIDTRPPQMTNAFPLPGAVRIRTDYTAATIPSVLGDNRNQRFIFMAQNNTLEYAQPTMATMKAALDAGYKSIEWYYPGVMGFGGWALPSEIPANIKIIAKNEAMNLLKGDSALAFVPYPDGKIISSIHAGPQMRKVPWSTRKFRHREFVLSSLPSNKNTPLIFVQKDATFSFVYEAAAASSAAGYSNVSVLPGGVYELELTK